MKRESRPAFTTPTAFCRTLATLTRGSEDNLLSLSLSLSWLVSPIESGHLRAPQTAEQSSTARLKSKEETSTNTKKLKRWNDPADRIVNAYRAPRGG